MGESEGGSLLSDAQSLPYEAIQFSQQCHRKKEGQDIRKSKVEKIKTTVQMSQT